LAAIIAENKQKLYWEEPDGSGLVMDGRKARNLVQSMTWLPFSKLKWGADWITAYRKRKDFRGLIADTHQELHTDGLGFDPTHLTKEPLILKIREHCPKMGAHSPIIADTVDTLKTDLLIWIEYGSRISWSCT
jgi:hypothetical protein